jgi:2,5-diamino-6-(ribosylamino)-4(3H)-pyrimidinone 5'-phosphate reductase
MTRPRVICHMATSIDGRIVVEGWPAAGSAAVRREYEQVHESYDADGWLCGRVTMEPFAKELRSDADVAREYSGSAPRDDFSAPGKFESFAFAVDASGRLAWESTTSAGIMWSRFSPSACRMSISRFCASEACRICSPARVMWTSLRR